MHLPRGWSGFATTRGCTATLGSAPDGAASAPSASACVEDESARGASTCAELGAQLLGRRLLHAAPEDLVGRNQHDAYDEGHGEGADEALPDTGLSVLLLGMHAFKLCLAIPRGLIQALLLVDDDVLNVLHR